MVFSPTANSAVEFLVKEKYGRFKKKKKAVVLFFLFIFLLIFLRLQS